MGGGGLEGGVIVKSFSMVVKNHGYSKPVKRNLIHTF